MEEKKIGRISHFFDKIGVAVLELTDGSLSVGDTIHIKGGTSDFTQKVSSMQMEHEQIKKAAKGQAIGMKTDQPVKEHDVVYLVK